MSVFEYRYIIR